MKKKNALLAIMLATVTLFTTACGNSGETSTETVTEKDELSGTITINMPAEIGAAEAWKAVGDAYMEKHPEVEVVVDLKPQESYTDWIKAQCNEENPAMDLFASNLAGPNVETINYLDYAYDESPYSGGPWNEQFDFDMQYVDPATGAWTQLCLSGTQILWFYNPDIFAEVGVEPPKTWDELIEVCDKIAQAGYQPIAMPGDFNSFWSQQMGWMCQAYVDQTTRDQIEIVKAQPGDWNYDETVDGEFVYDITDPHNDDPSKVNQNVLRFFQAFRDGKITADSPGIKKVMENFAKVFPQYAGNDNFFGTDYNGAQTLFYQGKAAMWLDGAWFFSSFFNTMDSVASGDDVKVGEQTVEGIQEFDLATFNMPSMEGEEFLAPARTIEVSGYNVGALKKDAQHNELVIDFLKYYSSSEGYGLFLEAAINNNMSIGIPLVNGVELSDARLKNAFSNIELIGNCQKGYGCALARGIGDNQEALRAWYAYTMDLMKGNIDINTWGTMHQENSMKYLPEVLEANKINPEDLDNPQNAPSGQ